MKRHIAVLLILAVTGGISLFAQTVDNLLQLGLSSSEDEQAGIYLRIVWTGECDTVSAHFVTADRLLHKEKYEENESSSPSEEQMHRLLLSPIQGIVKSRTDKAVRFLVTADTIEFSSNNPELDARFEYQMYGVEGYPEKLLHKGTASFTLPAHCTVSDIMLPDKEALSYVYFYTFNHYFAFFFDETILPEYCKKNSIVSPSIADIKNAATYANSADGLSSEDIANGYKNMFDKLMQKIQITFDYLFGMDNTDIVLIPTVEVFEKK